MRASHALLVAAVALFVSPARSEDWRIGVSSPLTSPGASSAIANQQGMVLAIEEYRKAKPAQKVELLFEDSQGRPEVGVAATEKLITRDQVHLVISDAFYSHVTMAVMELAPKYSVPIMSAEPVSSEIAKKVRSNPQRYRYFWKANVNSDAYGDSVFNSLRYLTDSKKLVPKKKTIGFVAEDTDYGRANAAEIKGRFEAIGWTVPLVETVPLGHTDFYPQLAKVRAAGPDVVVSIFTSAASGVALLKQYRELGVGSTHFGIYYPNLSGVLAQAGPAADGLLWAPLLYDPAKPGPNKVFADKIKARFNADVITDHVYGYCMMKVALDAFERAGGVSPDQIVEAISKTDYACVEMGRWVFDPADHAAKYGPGFLPYPAAQVQGTANVVFWPEQNATGTMRPQPWVR